MVVFVCDRLPNIEGKIDERPIAVFRNMKDTKLFLRILAANGIYACVKLFDKEAGRCT